MIRKLLRWLKEDPLPAWEEITPLEREIIITMYMQHLQQNRMYF